MQVGIDRIQKSGRSNPYWEIVYYTFWKLGNNLTWKAERNIALPFEPPNFRGFSAKYYFLESICLPANPTSPIPNKIRVVGSGLETVLQPTNSWVNCDIAETFIANERRKTVRATIYRYFFKVYLSILQWMKNDFADQLLQKVCRLQAKKIKKVRK